MADLALNLNKTAIWAMDFQEGIVSSNPVAQEQRVIDKAKSVLDGARWGNR